MRREMGRGANTEKIGEEREEGAALEISKNEKLSPHTHTHTQETTPERL